jgi:two-component system, cell cycle response regulator CpdR
MAATARILIVDDEPKMAAFLSLTFEHAGYTVRTAASGGDAIALLSEERFDVMLSDVMMPGMNGYQLVEWVAAHHPTTRTALMSGHDEVRRKCSYSLQCPLIAKPFSPTEILSFVGQVLAES